MKIKGNIAVKGIAIGYIQKVNNNIDEYLESYVQQDEKTEMEKYQHAVKQVKYELQQLVDECNSQDQDTAIMDAHLLMTQDIMLIDKITSNINNGESAPDAIKNASFELENMLKELEDSYFQERASDVKDVCNQILLKVLGIEKLAIKGSEKIIVADDLEPSFVASVNNEQVAGFVLKNGSTTSHAIIIARGKGIPTIVGADFDISLIEEDKKAIINQDGLLIIEPTIEEEKLYKQKKTNTQRLQTYFLSKVNNLAKTLDNNIIAVAANIALSEEAKSIEEYGAEGVGLYRTEFLYMESNQLPSEEKQFEAYKKAIIGCNGNLCIIRTLDIGGDKPSEALDLSAEENPFLGYRAIRICLDNKDLFKQQLRSIIKASAYGETAILLPMIINVDEIIKAKEIINEIMIELEQDKISYDKNIKIGIMIETPASVIMAPLLIKYVDFFSIGTNDLTQYTLAVDRGNQKVSHLYNYYNPAIIHSIKMVIDAAHKENKWVGVCGEMGADNKSIIALLALDIDELSMSMIMIPEKKEFIRNYSNNLVNINKLLDCKTPQEVEFYLGTIEKIINESIEANYIN